MTNDEKLKKKLCSFFETDLNWLDEHYCSSTSVIRKLIREFVKQQKEKEDVDNSA